MRQALNQNPVAQVVLIGVLAVIVGFLVLTHVSGGSSTSSTEESTSTPAPAGSAPAAPTDATTTPDATASTEAPAGTAPSSTPAAPAPAADFSAGPGLPAPVVDAYKRGDTVVLLVTRANGVDDEIVRPLVKRLHGVAGVALFETLARGIARYSRIATGVNLNRAPAIVVLSPKQATQGNLPQATVSYGYRGFDSIVQQIRDARYDGPQLPYYPR